MKQQKQQQHLLLAEDNTEMRLFLIEALSQFFEVTAVTNGRELGALLCDCRGLYDVVVADLIMPQWNGDEGMEHAAMFGVVVPVVFISGMFENPSIENAPNRAYLKKPFHVEELLDAITRVIREHARLVVQERGPLSS